MKNVSDSFETSHNVGLLYQETELCKKLVVEHLVNENSV
jgi:hypothetical protein